MDEQELKQNLVLLQQVMTAVDVQILCALKGYAAYSSFPLLAETLSGGSASSLNEAKLIKQYLKLPIHAYAPAFIPNEIDELLDISERISFNSINEWNRYRDKVKEIDVSPGLRINPEYSEIKTKLYDPADPTSRLGIPRSEFGNELPEGIEGLHFHVLCENNSFTLERVLEKLEISFGSLMHQCKWINLGGGHLITYKEYDIDHLIRLLGTFKSKYNVDIILEPGSAIGWEIGYLASTVLDIVNNNGKETALLDISFACHLPDCLEMPYKPEVYGESSQGDFQYSFGGVSCLAGDFVDGFRFNHPLIIGDRIIFKDMMHYTMVKTTTFNGVNLPSIATWRESGAIEILKTFGYEDYKRRL